MEYNITKCLANLSNNGWRVDANGKVKVQPYFESELDAYTFDIVTDREEYANGDLIFNTRSASFDIIVGIGNGLIATLPVGYAFSDDVVYISNTTTTDRNFPIVKVDIEILKKLNSLVVWGKSAIEIGKDVLVRFFGIVPSALVCSCCGKEISQDAMSMTYDRKPICYDCRKEHIRCPRCNRFFKLSPKNKDNLCPICAKREFVLPYHQYTPPLVFCGGEDDGNNLFLGLEMEVDNGGESNSNVKDIMHLVNPKDKQFLYCMHDGSLRDGLEIISQPATLKYHTSFKGQYTRLFEYLLAKGYLAHDTDTCGIHVHFNRSFYKDNEELYISRLLYLVDKFWDEIVKFSRRNQHRIDRYTKKLDRPIKTYIDQSNKSGNHDYHYYAINLANKNTIEFRMFKGSLNIETLFATLQLVNNCVICAKSKTIEELQKMTFEELLDGKSCKKYWQSIKNYTNTER